jgi:beta-N-acetylhexosaminidase
VDETPRHTREPKADRQRRLRRRRIEAGGIGTVVAAAAVVAGLMVGSNSAADQDKDAPSPSKGLSDHVLAGQRTLTGFDGTTVPGYLKKAIKKGQIGGVVLFSENLGSRHDIRKLTRDLQDIKRPAGLHHTPLLIMTDQEGGLVKRLNGAPDASAQVMGEKGGHYSKKQGAATGRNLKNAGINVDLAPVLDVARPGGEIADTERGFGSTAKKVEKTAIPFAKGVQSTGTAATAKHFPGLGSVTANTDDQSQTVDLSKSKLRHVDMAPYEAFIDAGGDMVMVGTAVYPAFSDKPAAFSKEVVTGELRKRLGFDGVTITDSLAAVAAQAFGSPKRIALAGAKAGMDLMLFSGYSTAIEGEDAMAKKLHSGSLKRHDFRKSVDRILELRQSLGN